jgi:ABC-type polysaccharide/polyol phosphate transport system ATPase subunit
VTLAPGEIVLDHASRSFSVRADRGRTLKELLLRRGAGGPPPARALHDVSLRVEAGETVGLVGRNGAGKTSTLNVLAGIIPLQSGAAAAGGRVVSLLELGAGFGRDFSGRENIELNGALHGLRREEVAERMEPIIAFSELGEFIDVPVRTYSSGMFVRLGFAIAAHLDADVLLIDEVLAVGDEAFQRKCLRRISEQIAGGTTLVLVSHDATAIERVCERVVVLEAGEVAYDGPTADGLLFYHRLMGTPEGAPLDVRRPDQGADHAVREIELADALGRPGSVFRPGDGVAVTIDLAVRPGAPQRWLVLEVRDAEGRRVFRTAAEPALVATGGALRFEIPRLALLGGDYDLAAGFAAPDEDPRSYDRVQRFAVLRVQGGEGVVDLRGTWTVADRARAAT